MKREPAWRVFAAEYNDATIEIKGTGEKTPSYIVTPLGGKINRVYITGVLTDVENVTEGHGAIFTVWLPVEQARAGNNKN